MKLSEEGNVLVKSQEIFPSSKIYRTLQLLSTREGVEAPSLESFKTQTRANPGEYTVRNPGHGSWGQ